MSEESTGKDRYSNELLAAAKYLLTTANPIEEGRYSSGLAQFSPEPSETLAIVRQNAYTALENCENPELPIISEDFWFIQVEEHIQRTQSTGLTRSWRNNLVTISIALTVVFVSIMGILGMQDLLWGASFLAAIIAIPKIPMAYSTWRKLRVSQEALPRIETVLSSWTKRVVWDD